MAWWLQLSLRNKIMALTTGLVLCSFAAGLLFMSFTLLDAMETELGRRAMSVARTVSQVEEVRENLGHPNGAVVIQQAVERMRLATGVEYIVTFDMNRTRYSHPLPALIGTRFEGGDEGPSLSQQAYVSRATGVNGNSVRAFVPVLAPDGSGQVGVVVVGIMVPKLPALVTDVAARLPLGLVAGLVVAVLGAWLLADHIKRQLFGLEPVAIAHSLEQRVAIVSAISEGLIAVSKDGTVTVVNDEALRILDAGEDVVGRNVLDVIPKSRFLETIQSGKAEYNQQMIVGRTLVVTNRVPIRIHDQIVGAVATFRDRTDVHHLAEELTGVTRFVDGLRAQNHESLNKLHTIAGLIQLEKYKEALDYIFSTTEQQQEVVRFLMRRVNDYRVSGLLLGKVIRGRELGIDLTFDPDTRMDAIPAPLDASDLVLLLGNLIENAMEALAGCPGARSVNCRLHSTAQQLEIQVADNGPGVPSELQTAIFRQGFSTKGDQRGLGLALVKELVTFAGGQVVLASEPGRTVFTITVKQREGGPNAAHACTDRR